MNKTFFKKRKSSIQNTVQGFAISKVSYFLFMDITLNYSNVIGHYLMSKHFSLTTEHFSR